MAQTEVREALLQFLDERVCLPALDAGIGQYAAQERRLLSRVQHSVRLTRMKYREEYASAEQVKANFLSDLTSRFGQDPAADMFMLKLTRFEDVKQEFLDLYRTVSDGL